MLFDSAVQHFFWTEDNFLNPVVVKRQRVRQNTREHEWMFSLFNEMLRE